MNKKQISISYDELITSLKCAYNKTLPAEIHGYLCGLICSGNCFKGSCGFSLSPDMLQDDFFATEESQKIAARLIVIAFEQLQDKDFEFQLMLPDDNEKIKFRMEALSKWCEQFLSGLGAGGVNQKLLDQTKLSEAIYDISEIARADYRNIKKNNDSESSYFELAEYVRVAVLTFFTETFAGAKMLLPKTEKNPSQLH